MNARGWEKGAARRRMGVLALLALAACGDGDRGGGERPAGKAADADTPRQGGTAVVAELSDISLAHPLFFEGGVDEGLMDIMFMSLTRGDWKDGRLHYLLSDQSPMALAWNYEYTGADSTALRYRMRSGLRWSDGRPITAHDVVWTYRMYADTTATSPRQSNVADIDSVVAENDSVVTFHFKRRYPEMLFDSGMMIAPRHAHEGVAPPALRTHTTVTRPETLPVSGPFRVGSQRPGQEFTLVPNPHFSVKPRLDRIVFRVIPDITTRLVELQNGTVHFARSVPFDQVPLLRQRAPDLQFDREQDRFWEFIAYNPRTVPQFADPEIRRALGMAMDVPGMIRQLRMDDYTTVAAGPYSPLFKELYDPQRMRPLAFDSAGAKRILEGKGWRDTDGDGIREKDGKPFRFTLITNTGNQRRADVSQILQRMWRDVGVDVRLQQYDLGTFQEKMIRERDYQAALGSWGVELTPNFTGIWGEKSLLNVVDYRNPEVTRLMAQAEAQPTAALANPLWRAAAERIVQDQPYTWLYYYDPVTGRSSRLRGVDVDTYGAYQNAWEWWVTGGPAGGARADTAQRDTGR
ncbi:MAG TPA: ABC transporter substrate-binding protein [Longimicrobium sp.]|uniref:ABC transporter substrate-binding protein n=1 Tax=Longimicrobium sp. TaxID=2029185 RepID=UPI002ED9A828